MDYMEWTNGVSRFITPCWVFPVNLARMEKCEIVMPLRVRFEVDGIFHDDVCTISFDQGERSSLQTTFSCPVDTLIDNDSSAVKQNIEIT